jgi:hypothetical protein
MICQIIVLSLLSTTSVFAERRDPPREASQAQIAKIMRQAKRIAVFCGNDIDQQVCIFFSNALRVALKGEHIAVDFHYEPEFLANQDGFTLLLGARSRSFYIPPVVMPFNDAQLRLIEDSTGRDGATRLYAGGFCFDYQCQDTPDCQSGDLLPLWVQVESARDTGPLELDRAQAASKLAKEFAAYWISIVRGKH